LQLAIIWKFLS